METTAGVAALGTAALVIAAIAVFWLISFIFAAPRRIRGWNRARRIDRGLKALAAGMVAVAAGDPRGASRQARRAENLLDAAPLTLLLSAQAAQLEGDDTAAENYFKDMLARPDTEFLGLRGLLIQAGRAGDSARALAYAERAAELRPDSSWVQRSLFELSVKSGLWGEAEAALKRAVKRGAIERDLGARHRAAILLQQSADAAWRDFTVEARNLAGKARRAAPDFVPASVRFAGFERAAGRKAAARRVLERAWRLVPHPELAAAYGPLCEAKGAADEVSEDAVVLARVQGIERLVAKRLDHPESHLALAEAALDARLWGEARGHLDRALDHFRDPASGEAAPARLYRLFARCEEEANGDSAAAARYLAQAGEAAPDPRWICGECGQGFAAWSATCPHCQSFDSLNWGRPEPITTIAAGPAGTHPAALFAGAEATTVTAPPKPRGDEV
jgi:HemY protein